MSANPKKINGLAEFSRWVSLLALVMVGLGQFSCGSVNYSGKSAAEPQPVVRAPAVEGLRIPEDVLRSNGLTTRWTQPVEGTEFKEVFLVGDEIYCAEKRGRKHVLVDYKRADGYPRWEWDLKAPVQHTPSPYRYAGADKRDDELYIVQKDQVYCLDLNYGTTLWKSNLDFSVSGGVVAGEEHFYVGSYNGRIYGIPKKESVDDWFYITRGAVSSSGVMDPPFPFFTSSDGSAFRFHPTKGARDETFWQFSSGASVSSSPALHSNFVYVGSHDYKLYSLLAIDGSVNWEFQAQAPIKSAPKVAIYRPNLAIVFAISEDRRPAVNRKTLWAINAVSGELLWKKPFVDDVIASGKKSIYYVTEKRSKMGRSLVAVDGETGKERFSMSVDQFEFIPSTLGAAATTQKHDSLIYLIDQKGLIQAIGESY